MQSYEAILSKHGVIPHVREGDSPSTRRQGGTMLGRDAAMELLQVLQEHLDEVKDTFGKKKYLAVEAVGVLCGEVVRVVGCDVNKNGVPYLDLVSGVVKAAEPSTTKKVTWDDILSFMIDAGMHGFTADLPTTYKGFSEVLSFNGSNLTGYQDLLYVPEKKMILGNELGHQLRWIDPSADYYIHPQVMVCSDPESRTPPPAILSFSYLHSQKTVIAGCGDLSITLFSSSGKLVHKHHVDTTVTVVRCIDGKLYTGDRDGKIWFWNMKREYPEGGLTEKAKAGNIALGAIPIPVLGHKVPAHSSAVTDIIWLDSRRCLITSSTDQTITILSRQGTVVRTLKHAHGAPIAGIAFAETTDMLLSYGSTPDAYVWKLSNTNHKPFKLADAQKPHVGSLGGLMCVSGTSQVITCDTRGLVKIWCLNTFGCLQTLQCSVSTNTLTKGQASPVKALIVIPEQRQIVAANTNRAWVFEYDAVVGNSLGLRQSAHDCVVVCTQYNSADNTIVTFAGFTVSVWCLTTGTQLARYDLQHEITSACLTEDGVYFIAGKPLGMLSVYNLASGKWLKDIASCHTSDITSITVCEGKNAVLSSAWDGSVFMTTLDEHRFPSSAEAGAENNTGWSPTAKDMTKPQQERAVDGKCGSYSKELGLCAVGDAKDSVTLWGTPKDTTIDLRAFAKCQPENAALAADAATLREVTAVEFIYSYPALVSANSIGHVHMFSVAPYPYPNQCLSWWPNTAPQRGSKAAVVGVSCLCLLKAHDSIVLYTGDDEGHISCYNIGLVLREYGIMGKAVVPEPYPDPTKHAVHVVQRWRGHAGGVHCLTGVQERCVIVSSGSDRQVAVWTMNGVLVGSLDQNGNAPYGLVTGKLDIDEASMKPADYDLKKEEPSLPATPFSCDAFDYTLTQSVKPMLKIQPKYRMGGGPGSVRRGSRRSTSKRGSKAIETGSRRKSAGGWTDQMDAVSQVASVKFNVPQDVGSVCDTVGQKESPKARLPTLYNGSQRGPGSVKSATSRTSRKSRVLSPISPSPPPTLPRRESLAANRILPEGYLSILAGSSVDGPLPSPLTMSGETTTKDLLESPSLSSTLPPGSHEYYTKMKQPPKPTLQVEVTSRLTGQSKVLLLKTQKKKKPSRTDEVPWWEELEQFHLTP
eukprot:TRINITY_DN6057_c0_g3_i1.p1 TRINITY_DN6057_c0_g3~~TRINITY_DN6057_c0_g3_i1.p1  ORF type:complete len:1145 (+),score=314.80 TRINITY_DN6057_c0_g3_i1:2295-5729(+)